LVEAAPDLTPLIYTSRKVNDAQPRFVLRLVARACGRESGIDVDQIPNLAGLKIAALGLAFKPDVDDLRESPAVEVCHLLQQAGAHVTAYEPFKLDDQIEGLHTVPELRQAVHQADVVLVLVAHAAFKNLTPDHLVELTDCRTVVDAVGIWNTVSWQSEGFSLHRLGDGQGDTH
jgi:UDP-N-acetyl-D-mannosaminuronic acid dehydrogenase